MKRRISAILATHADVRFLTTWEELRSHVQKEEVDAVIADVLANAEGDPTGRLERLRADHPTLPVIVYTELSPESASILLKLGRAGLRRVIFHRFEEEGLLGALTAEGVRLDRDLMPAVEERIIVRAGTVTDQLIRALAQQPDLLYTLSARAFEELVADLLAREGYAVTLTSATRDGGKDVIVACTSTIGNFAYYVECKRFAREHRVGVPVVRELYGAVQADRVTGGIVATTSFFTKDALAFQSQVPYQVALRDFQNLAEWLTRASHQLD